MRTGYQETMAREVARLGRDCVNLRHVEAWIRADRPCLDGLSREQLRAEVRTAAACADHAGWTVSEKLAKSFGL